jgi:hypothetical protein
LRDIRAHLAPNGIFAVWISDFLSVTEPGFPSYVHTFYPTKKFDAVCFGSCRFYPIAAAIAVREHFYYCATGPHYATRRATTVDQGCVRDQAVAISSLWPPVPIHATDRQRSLILPDDESTVYWLFNENRMRLLIVLGTRPEAIKLAPVIVAAR